MVKTAVLVCVMVLGWSSVVVQGFSVEEEEEEVGSAEMYENEEEEAVTPTEQSHTEKPHTEVVPFTTVPTKVVPSAPHFNRTEVCNMAPQKGPCKARLPRYFYKSSSASCEIFFYGGCGGNQNNFKNEEKCLESCGTQDEPTHSPLVTEATPVEAN